MQRGAFLWYCSVVLFGRALNATPEAISSREYRDDFVSAGTIAIPLRVFDQAARSPELNAPVRLVTSFRLGQRGFSLVFLG